jgi:putative membrane protein
VAERDERSLIVEDSADRRTDLAVERTQLAWWRTGLTAVAVAIGVGRVVPELSESETTWPYVLAGILFALYGVALFLEGTARARELVPGDNGGQPRPRETLLAVAGPALAILVIILIVVTG